MEPRRDRRRFAREQGGKTAAEFQLQWSLGVIAEDSEHSDPSVVAQAMMLQWSLGVIAEDSRRAIERRGDIRIVASMEPRRDRRGFEQVSAAEWIRIAIASMEP